jgi:hypothetical protein
MMAYFVHDTDSGEDRIILPEASCSVKVDADRFEAFIGPDPAFGDWAGESCSQPKPEDFGTVVATRVEKGDVCIVDAPLWNDCLARYAGPAR